MRTISNDFRDALRGIKELIGVVSYRTSGGHLITQANEYILTQADEKIRLESATEKYKVLTTEHSTMLTTEANKILATEKEQVEIDNDNIISINVTYDGKLLNTICQSLQIESKEDIDVNTKINVKIGVMVNDEYEYVDLGYFYNIEPSEYQLDTNTYIITAYDRMYRSMKKYESLNIFPCTHRELLEEILNLSGIEFDIPSYDNEDKIINQDYWKDYDVTYRDILDELCVSGGFGAIIKNNIFIPKVYYDTEEIVNAEDLQESDVSIGEKYGPINLVEIESAEGILYEIGKDASSIEENGVTEFNLGLNRILENDEDGEFYQSVFDALNGLEFYTYDLASTGLLIFEPLDMFEIKRNGTYPTILLNDSITLTTGLKENLYLKKPEENVDEYVSSAIDDKKLKNAIIKVDKANGQIVLKADSNGNIVQATLNADADNGSLFDVKADNINFEGHTFNLTADDININSQNFQLDNEGNMTCNNANIGGTLSQLQVDDYYNIITNIGDPNNTGNCIEIMSVDRGTEQVRFKTYINPGNVACYYGDKLQSLFGYGGVVYLYDVNNDTRTIAMDGYTGNITCVSLTQTSLEENKKEFEKLENALDIVKDTDIYKYHFKTEKDTDKKHIGFVIGDNFKYRKEITSLENDGVDTYAMISVLWKAVQEQQKEIEELKEVAYGRRKD